MVGTSFCSSSGDCINFNPPPCAALKYPSVWDPDSGDLERLADAGAEVRAVNKHFRSAGWAYLNTNPMNCHENAVAWNGDAIFDLGSVMPDGEADDQSRAEGINDLLSPQVVGWNDTLQTGLSWQHNPDEAWEVTDLTSAIANCGNVWTVIQGHDVNDSGWIAAIAKRDVGGSFALFGVVLTPINTACPADINQDGTVDVLDLLAVISGWGPCVSQVICSADLNFDCTVDVLDLLAVIGAYGDCPDSLNGLSGGQSSMESSASVQDCFDLYLDDIDSLIECIQSFGGVDQ